MIIDQIKLQNFRLYENQTIKLNERTNILVGENAQGKTTVIEAINVLGLTKSHKTTKDKDMIQTNKEHAKINALVHLKQKDIHLDIILSKNGKKAKYNQIELDRLSDYIGQLNVVLFAPEDLDLIKGNPQTRRKFLDLEIGQISREYLHNLQNYKKILKERNELLKSMQKRKDHNLMLLDIITEQLISYMEPIVNFRKAFIKEINDYIRVLYQEISNQDIECTVQYVPNVEKDFKEEFSVKYQYDIITGTTNLGVHRDDIEFFLNGFPIKTHGSQGELRSAILSTKLALVDFIHNHKKVYPILLLDDVLSELDETRQNNLITLINNKTQTVITTTNINDIQLNKIDHYTVFNVTNGTIKECETHG